MVEVGGAILFSVFDDVMGGHGVSVGLVVAIGEDEVTSFGEGDEGACEVLVHEDGVGGGT